MKRLLTDFLPFTFDENQKMVYILPTLTGNEYIHNEKRPIVDINVEIGTEEVLKKVEENRQSSNLYYKKKDRIKKKNKGKANENKNKSKNDNEKEKLKRIIVEMKVYDDKDFFRRIMINSMKSYSTYYTRGSKYKEIINVYSLNFIYGKLKKNKNKNNSSKNKNSKYIHDLYFNDPSDYEEYCFNDVHVFVVELSKFDINNFNENDAKDLWTAFFKSITYKVEYNKKRKHEGGPKTVKVILNHLTEELYKKLSKIDEIKEAIDICEIPGKVDAKIKVDEEYYKNYVNSVLNDEKVEVLERMNEELENENYDIKSKYDAIQTRMDALEGENNDIKSKYDAIQTRMDALEGEKNDIKSKYESLMKDFEELKKKNN